MSKLEVEVLGRMPTLNSWLSGTHWRTKHNQKKEWQETIGWALKSAKFPEKLEPFWLEVTMFTTRMRDHDNCVIGAKFFLDSLKDGGYIEDDSPKYVKGLTLQWQKATKEEKTIFTIV